MRLLITVGPLALIGTLAVVETLALVGTMSLVGLVAPNAWGDDQIKAHDLFLPRLEAQVPQTSKAEARKSPLFIKEKLAPANLVSAPIRRNSPKPDVEVVDETEITTLLPKLSLGEKSRSAKMEPDLSSVIFDIPMSYNQDVKNWIKYFQTNGRSNFKRWIERSHKYLPLMQRVFKENGLPQDLAYMAMIESGFSSHAVSSASAVGPWQFIKATADRYGLKTNWWIDERRDFEKSTKAAAKYLNFLHSIFGAWYLVAAGYNAGENYMIRLIEKHQTRNFWALSHDKKMYQETKNYVPKLIAAVLISKAPSLYGFRDLKFEEPMQSELFFAPPGTYLSEVADHLGVTHHALSEINPELIHSYIPDSSSGHWIRIPKGSYNMVSGFFKKKIAER